MLIFSQEDVARAVRRLAMQVVEKNKGTADLVMIGIRGRGVVLAKRMREIIRESEGAEIPLGVLNVGSHARDGAQEPLLEPLGLDIEGKDVVLCDAVLYTGRTVHAALSALSSLGRAKTIRLYCLVDRGHRELPFAAEGVGRSFPTSRRERIEVHFVETDGKDEVTLIKPQEDQDEE